jgi:glycosyltransferase involved in cell wall biosynthesis
MMKPRRVLYVAKTAKGGSAISLYHLARGLDKSRYEPLVLFYAKHSYTVARLAEAGVKTIFLKNQLQVESSSGPAGPVKHRDIGGWLEAHLGKRAGQTYVFLKACYQFIRQEMPKIRPIVRAIRENEIDLVHVNSGLRHGKPGIIAAWLTKTPCVCHVRMFHKLNLFDKVFTPFIDAFVYNSNAIAKDYIAQGVPPLKGTVVHNGVDLGRFTPIHDAAQVRSEFGWTTHERLVGVIGRLDWWKGHEYFLEAMAEVAQQIPSLRGLIVGESENTPLNQEYYRKLKSSVKSLKVDNKVIFTGFRSDVPRLMAALDVVVLSSSLPEPFGRVVIEGMAAGKPVVATAAGGVLDIIEDGVNGLLVPCKDAKAMAQAIFWLLSNQEQAEQIGRAARQRVAEKFTVPHYVAAVQSVYDTLMGKAQSRMAPLGIIGK